MEFEQDDIGVYRMIGRKKDYVFCGICTESSHPEDMTETRDGFFHKLCLDDRDSKAEEDTSDAAREDDERREKDQFVKGSEGWMSDF